MEFHHIPVMLTECLSALSIRPEGTYVDGTAGGAGHSLEIAKRLTTGRLIALDKDPHAVAAAEKRLSGLPVTVTQSDFRYMRQVLSELGIGLADGILLDLGVSSHQLDAAERGFSYSQNAPLDMRMSGSGFSAGDLLNTWSADEMTRIFREYGEEKYARRISLNIEAARSVKPLETTFELVDIIRASIPAPARRQGGHPAKRVFQAVRIAVNSELEALESGVASAFDSLAPGGRLAVITFHSLEDRIVKRAFSALCTGCVCPPDFPVCVCGKMPKAKAVTKKPMTAGKDELSQNSRAKSAKLRALEKTFKEWGNVGL